MDNFKMSFQPVAVAMASALLLALASSTQAGDNGQPTPEEQEAASALAARLGMPGPVHVSKTWWGLPGGCEALLAESAPVVEGNKRSWQQLYLGRTVKGSAGACPSWPTGTEVLSESGLTAARSNLHEMTTWRFVYDSGFVDIRLGADVSYAAAETLIRALQDHSWRDARKQADRNLFPGLAKSTRHLISGIRHIGRSTRVPGGYEVRLDVLMMVFSLDGPSVTLHSSSMVIN